MLNITTLAGVRLDLYPNVTIELNMGGISLLDLSSRTATYTNSFSLPRTPTNESVFAFASQPTRNNRPSVDVWITKGLFQRKAVLKVLEFEKEYKCSVSYSDSIDSLKNYYYDNLYYGKTLANTTTTNFVNTLCGGGYNGLVYLNTTGSIIPNAQYATKSLYVKLSTLITNICNANGLTLSGNLLTDVDYLSMYVNLPNLLLVSISNNHVTNTRGFLELKKTALDIIKKTCLLFFADFISSNKNIEINKIDIAIDGINIEGFANVSKDIYSNLAAANNITYDISETITNKTGLVDSFAADGVGSKELINLGLYIPSVGVDGYYSQANDSKMIFMSGIQETGVVVSYYNSPYTVNVKKAAPLSISGFYSNILNPIFASPVILEANKYLDPLTADNIMNTRVINSVQLGGRYWVDQMAYNLTTGQSKMTLIKLP